MFNVDQKLHDTRLSENPPACWRVWLEGVMFLFLFLACAFVLRPNQGQPPPAIESSGLCSLDLVRTTRARARAKTRM